MYIHSDEIHLSYIRMYLNSSVHSVDVMIISTQTCFNYYVNQL